jgi:hypothetical protein
MTGNFPQLLHAFFHEWLAGQRNNSRHTVRSYRDTWRLFLRFHGRATAAAGGSTALNRPYRQRGTSLSGSQREGTQRVHWHAQLPSGGVTELLLLRRGPGTVGCWAMRGGIADSHQEGASPADMLSGICRTNGHSGRTRSQDSRRPTRSRTASVTLQYGCPNPGGSGFVPAGGSAGISMPGAAVGKRPERAHLSSLARDCGAVGSTSATPAAGSGRTDVCESLRAASGGFWFPISVATVRSSSRKKGAHARREAGVTAHLQALSTLPDYVG